MRFRFTADALDPTRLLEDELERVFGEKIPALVKTSAEVIAIAESIPIECLLRSGR